MDPRRHAYSREGAITGALKGHIDEVANFTGYNRGRVRIDEDMIEEQVLQVAVPRDALSQAQRLELETARTYAEARYVRLEVVTYP